MEVSFIIFMVLGMIEVFALFALMFRTFRLPYFEYLKEVAIISLVVTLISYVIRVYFSVSPIYDVLTSYLIYFFFFRYLIKVKYWKAAIISLLYFGYALISTAVYAFFVLTNIFPSEVIDQSNSIASYSIQITSAAIAFLVAWMLTYFGYGFSFISKPPHDFYEKSEISKRERLVVISIGITAVIFFVTYYVLLQTQNLLITPIIALSFFIVIYLSDHRDMYR